MTVWKTKIVLPVNKFGSSVIFSETFDGKTVIKNSGKLFRVILNMINFVPQKKKNVNVRRTKIVLLVNKFGYSVIFPKTYDGKTVKNSGKMFWGFRNIINFAIQKCCECTENKNPVVSQQKWSLRNVPRNFRWQNSKKFAEKDSGKFRVISV